MSVYARTEAALGGLEDDYRKAVALTLAQVMDDAPNAAVAGRLLSLMAELTDGAVEEVPDDVADLAAKRAARLAGAKDHKRSAGGDVRRS